MGRAKYQCKSCLNRMEIDVPQLQNASQFANKVPCTKCGKVGCTWQGGV